MTFKNKDWSVQHSRVSEEFANMFNVKAIEVMYSAEENVWTKILKIKKGPLSEFFK